MATKKELREKELSDDYTRRKNNRIGAITLGLHHLNMPDLSKILDEIREKTMLLLLEIPEVDEPMKYAVMYRNHEGDVTGETAVIGYRNDLEFASKLMSFNSIHGHDWYTTTKNSDVNFI